MLEDNESSDARRISECIYCGNSELTSTHIFPKLIGGRSCPKLACKQCNEEFGHVEAELVRNHFFAQAIAYVLKDPHKGFGKAKLTVSGYPDDMEWTVDKDRALVPRTKIVKGRGGYASTKKLIDIISGSYTGGDKASLLESIRNEVPKPIEIGDRRIEKIRPSGLTNKLRIGNLDNNVNPVFLAKVAYEHLALMDLHNEPVVQAFRNDFLVPIKRVVESVDHELNARIGCLGDLSAINDISKMDPAPIFKVYVGITETKTVFVVIGFYRIVSFAISIGKCLIKADKFDSIGRLIAVYSCDKSDIMFGERPPRVGGGLNYASICNIADALLQRSQDRNFSRGH